MENILVSTILDTDSYKLSHWPQYPQGTEGMYSYLESRGGEGDKTLFFGLQYITKKYLSTPITAEMVEEAKVFAALHGTPFNYDGWMYIVNVHGGFLPVEIKAVPEGMVIPKKNILMSVESLDPACFWVVSWLETIFVRLWYPITVATNSYKIKSDIMHYEKLSVDDDKIAGDIAFKLHDFGSRGASCQEAAGIGGMSHLINFKGSDTIAGVYYANKYYNCEMAGFSIPASEHSTMTMWGRDNEIEAYRNMIKQYGDGAIFACVSDSYDVYNATEKLWGEELKQEVMNMNATLVVRPDSGDPVLVPVELVEVLDRKYGSTVNSKGYKVLNKVRVIQGDGIDRKDVSAILELLTARGYSAENINFGMGGGLLQRNMDRDTHKFAFKCSWAKVNNEEVEVFKQPITDKVKISKKGKLHLACWPPIDEPWTLKVKTVEKDSILADAPNLLRTVYQNGVVLCDDSFETIRERTAINIASKE